jgi:hypothetical protein
MHQITIAGLSFSLVATAAAHASVVTFQDTTMAPASFTIGTIGSTPQQVSAATDATGGGALRVKTMSNAAVYTTLARSDWTITATEAATATISATVDFKPEYTFLQGMGYSLLAMQGGSAYVVSWATTSQGGTDVGNGWKRRALGGVGFEDFAQIGNANARLNLTATGGTITLGFLTGNSVGSGITVLYDNLGITLNGVVPGPGGLAAWGAAALLTRRRARR